MLKVNHISFLLGVGIMENAHNHFIALHHNMVLDLDTAWIPNMNRLYRTLIINGLFPVLSIHFCLVTRWLLINMDFPAVMF